MTQREVLSKVRLGEINRCCWDCADKYREYDKKPYDGTYNIFIDICQICKYKKKVTSASKAFGYHRFL